MARTSLVARSPEVVYRLVEDIESYPQFVPGCTSAEVLERNEHMVVARLAVRRGPLRSVGRTARDAALRLQPWRRGSADSSESRISCSHCSRQLGRCRCARSAVP